MTSIAAVLDRAREVADDPAAYADRHAGSVLALCFFEPSTRTRMSFDSAAKRLGMNTIGMGDVDSSSVSKGSRSRTPFASSRATRTHWYSATPARAPRHWPRARLRPRRQRR